MNDRELLRLYEPVVHFTRGELFFPCAVDEYVRDCSLLERTADRGRPPLIEAGSLDPETLAAAGDRYPDLALCLRFVQEPFGGRALQQWQRREGRPEFHAPGRLARVGLASRSAEALFTLSLLLRGSVPGGTAAAAEQQYRAMQARLPGYVYHGRVVRQGGYVCLQYLFFYAMNDWRSTFSGVNDHEADWEQIFLYLEERPDGPPVPAWAAYASHDFAGDDLRRRWDDPELQRQGTHPVVFAGAGSHASYFAPGEYLTSVEVRPLRRVVGVVNRLRRVWQETLGQGNPEAGSKQVEDFFSIPFVDYARGDGLAIGPGQEVEWSPVVLTEETAWAERYRGLWGLDTRDPLSGELAPSGPKFNRDGSVRRSWYDPLGWAGLGKVAPPTTAAATLAARIDELAQAQAETAAQIDGLLVELPKRDLEVRALQGRPQLAPLYKESAGVLAAQESELNTLQARRNEVSERLSASREYLERLEAGDPGDPRAHIQRSHEPESRHELRRQRLADLWAAVSIGVLLLGGVAVFASGLFNWAVGLLLVFGTVIVVESVLRGTTERLLLNLTIVLAIACTAVLVYSFYWPLLLLLFATIAVLILADNIRELRRGVSREA